MGSLYSRLFALGYDSFLAWGERAGMQALRRDALAEAAGSVLEIGAGTGLNGSLYPADVERITFSEPDQAMRHRLSQRLASLGRRHDILDAPADHLPVDSGAVDTVVSTLVLCTVADLAATLAEVRRVLAPVAASSSSSTFVLRRRACAAGKTVCADRGWPSPRAVTATATPSPRCAIQDSTPPGCRRRGGSGCHPSCLRSLSAQPLHSLG